MPVSSLSEWLHANARPESVWLVKRLSGNDTLANGSHQAGPYIPKAFLFEQFPSLDTVEKKNPDVRFDLYVDSHADHRTVRAIYYNGKRFGDGTRDETRLTNFGGRMSALLDPESTGALAVFAFAPDGMTGGIACHVWVCANGTEEEDLVEEWIGPVEPGSCTVWNAADGRRTDLFFAPVRADCSLSRAEIPPAWLERFPSGEEIIRKSVAMRSSTGDAPDRRILRRRACEFEIFRSVEKAYFGDRIKGPFESIEAFLSLAQSLLQSRKSRSGNSLELHAREIFTEEGLKQGADFQHKPVIEDGKRPDFLFPSQAAYEDNAFPADRLRMLAVKTTCRDRWRQILNEANRIPRKCLLTLQEGVSEGQFREMNAAGVQLVVPQDLHVSFPAAVRPHLVSLESFIADVRLLSVPG
ncbi:MAG: type II restriction endonuclease [Alphaproteobacteria bacterium]|nr:type II restriction endonuclease [Alphaproteobacteria bacterium]